MYTRITLASPRLKALQAQLAATRDPAACLPPFWEEIISQGLPLIEIPPEHPDQVLATFLWRGDEDLRNVLVVARFTGTDPTRGNMTHFPGTDIWFRSLLLPRGLRALYQLSPGDPLTPLSAEGIRHRTATWRSDPLNPRRFALPGDPESGFAGRELSILELPGAAPGKWPPPAPSRVGGRLDMIRLTSPLLGNERRVWRHTPVGFRPGDGTGLLVLLDGLAFHTAVPTPAILDTLQAEHRLPPLAAFLPDSLDVDTRTREFSCSPHFSHFLARELVPGLRSALGLRPDPARTIVAGSGLGGLAALYAAFRHPEVFGNALSISGSLWWHPLYPDDHEWLAGQFAAVPRLPLRIALLVGSHDLWRPKDEDPTDRITNRHLRDVLQAREYPLAYREYPGCHDHLNLAWALSDGLTALTAGWGGPSAAPPL